MTQPTSARRRRWVLTTFGLLVLIIAAWSAHVAAWYISGYPAALKAKQAFILNPVNQPPILAACQKMLANPAAYPQRSGEPYPAGMPPALAALGADSVSITPNGVLITFGRNFGLWAIPAGATTPNLPMPTARPLIPGLWYLTYPGN